MTVSPSKLKVLNDFRLDLRVRVCLRKLDGQIHAVNATLGSESPAIAVLKAQALSLAAQIDELRGLLAKPKR